MMSWKGWWGIVHGLVQRNLNFYYDGTGKLVVQQMEMIKHYLRKVAVNVMST
jgi:hypothetical protein